MLFMKLKFSYTTLARLEHHPRPRMVCIFSRLFRLWMTVFVVACPAISPNSNILLLRTGHACGQQGRSVEGHAGLTHAIALYEGRFQRRSNVSNLERDADWDRVAHALGAGLWGIGAGSDTADSGWVANTVAYTT